MDDSIESTIGQRLDDVEGVAVKLGDDVVFAPYISKQAFECGFMAHICVIGSSSMVVTLETFFNSEAIIAVYANPVHISKTEQVIASVWLF